MSEVKNGPQRGVVIELDFTAIDGASLLFDCTSKVLAKYDVKFSIKLEALNFYNHSYQNGVAELFHKLEKEGDYAAIGHEIADEFKAALTAAAADAITPGFKACVKKLTEQGVKVLVVTRADVEAIRPAFADLDPEMVILYAETATTYGCCKWDAWRRACTRNGLVSLLTVGVTGSGYGVKSVLVAGMSAIAIVHDHVAYQDFGGVDSVEENFSEKLADDMLRMLHLV